MSVIDRLQKWFVDQCNGDWEHNSGISISTLDNPGWSIKIHLLGTAVEDVPFSRLEAERTEKDFIHAWRTSEDFNVACGPNNLEEALRLFCDWANA